MPTDSPSSEERRAEEEARSIDRQMQVLERHRADTERRTSQAIRRIPLVLGTMLLVALLLLWMLRS
jgi:hypothetical protein